MTKRFHFVVTAPFDDYQRGEVITDTEVIKNIEDPDHDMHAKHPSVRRINASESDASADNTSKSKKSDYTY